MRIKTDKFENASLLGRKCAWAAAAVVPLLLAGCGEEKVAEVLVRPVKAMVRAGAGDRARPDLFRGDRAAHREHTRFPSVRQIVERYVNVGQHVQAGQKIAKLDEKDLKLAEHSARAAAAAAKTRFEVARDALNRAEDSSAAKALYRPICSRSAAA